MFLYWLLIFNLKKWVGKRLRTIDRKIWKTVEFWHGQKSPGTMCNKYSKGCSNLSFSFLQRIVCSSTSRCSYLSPKAKRHLNKFLLAWLPSSPSCWRLGKHSSLWSTTTGLSMDLSIWISSGSCCLVAVHLHPSLFRKKHQTAPSLMTNRKRELCFFCQA